MVISGFPANSYGYMKTGPRFIVSPKRHEQLRIERATPCYVRVNIFFRNQILSGYVFSENRLLLVNVLCLECGVNRGEYGSAKTKSLKC